MLSHKHEIGLTKLVEAVNSTYNEVMRNVRILEGEGIVTLRRCGHRRYIILNYDNFKTKILVETLHLLDSRSDFTRLHGALVA
jgi:predicted transcriptional regulator